MKHYRWLIISIFSLGLLVPMVVARADSYGVSAVASVAGLDKNVNTLELMGKVIGAALSMIGVLFFILMLYGGILWMAARGNEEHSKKALNTIIAACIGIVIVLASYSITGFVLNSIKSSAPRTPSTCPEHDKDDGGVEVRCVPQDMCANEEGQTTAVKNTSYACLGDTTDECCTFTDI